MRCQAVSTRGVAQPLLSARELIRRHLGLRMLPDKDFLSACTELVWA